MGAKQQQQLTDIIEAGQSGQMGQALVDLRKGEAEKIGDIRDLCAKYFIKNRVVCLQASSC